MRTPASMRRSFYRRLHKQLRGLSRAADLPLGYVLYDGPSGFDPHVRIVAVMTLESTNLKTTGSADRERVFQPQVWIFRADMHPSEAVSCGADAAICGDCPFRAGAGCYVRMDPVVSIWRAWQRGRYAAVDWSILRSLMAGVTYVRLGAYGDPAAVPLVVWERLETACADARIIGYTHAWKDADRRYARWLMASVETAADRLRARALGFRTFRIRAPGSPLARGEFVCPASHEAGSRRSCEQARCCDGSRRGMRADPVIVAHGPRSRKVLSYLASL